MTSTLCVCGQKSLSIPDYFGNTNHDFHRGYLPLHGQLLPHLPTRVLRVHDPSSDRHLEVQHQSVLPITNPQSTSANHIYRHQGYMPDGRSGNWNGLVQGGSDADNVLADAYVKGLRGSINWTDGYAAMLKDAEVTPYNTFDPTDFTASTKEGRGALDDWKELGYVSEDRNTRSISRTVEYSLNDFALSQVANGEMPGDVQKYLNRSAGWQNIWDETVESLNFTGFLAPKFSDGTFNSSEYDPRLCGGCEWSSYTYEAVPWGMYSRLWMLNWKEADGDSIEYSFVIPHDVETLIKFMGGSETFDSRLDMMVRFTRL